MSLEIKIKPLKYIFLLVLINTFNLYSQESNLHGRVTDTLLIPLQHTNILAIPKDSNQDIKFSITDKFGNYKLSLKKDIFYKIEITYLGFQKISDSITLQKDITKDFTLLPGTESLEEVLIKQRLPVLVKKDTITYRTDVFLTGEERKLREVLKKLPGVEVDRAGNVTVNGKKVDKLLVEGKIFFTGDTKLGVNNIPADAIDEVVVLDNYSEIPFLKGLEDSDKMALNIKLKEGKKKFVFGDIEVGGGIEDRYLAHPTLFYYSPKTSVNTIVDFNNIGKQSFTFNDYVNFEGGFTKLVDDPKGYFNLANSDFATSLQNQDFVFNRNSFGAFNIAQQLSPNTNINAYSIVNGSTTETRVSQVNTFLIDNTISDIENRTTTNKFDSFFTLNKATLKYIPNADEDLSLSTVVKTSTGDLNEQLQSQTLTTNGFVNTQENPTSYEILNTFSYSKQFSNKHTSTLQADFNVVKNKNKSLWDFSDAIFNTLVPVEGDAPFNLSQNIDYEDYSSSFQLKHYWVLSTFHHIYPVLGHNFSKQNYSSLDAQIIDTETNDFSSSGFNNDTSFLLNDSFVGFQYKTKIDDITIKPGLIYHYYYWDIEQFNQSTLSRGKAQFLPELLVDWALRSSEKIKLDYGLKSQFNDASFYANRFRLSGFNNIYQGNESLENELYHQASLSYSKFSLLKGLFYNARLSYIDRINTIRSATIIDGINQISTSIFTDLPERTLSSGASISKKVKKIKFSLSANLSRSSYSRTINELIVDFSSNNYGYNFKAETSFKNYPNLEVGVSQAFNDFGNDNFSNKFSQTEPYAILQYDFLNDFIFKADYRYNRYENKGEDIVNNFEIGNASLFYNKEDSPWGFEIDVDNIFNVNFKNENSFDQFIIRDQRTFIQPRTALFKISYKL